MQNPFAAKDDQAFEAFYLESSILGIRIGLTLSAALFLLFGFIFDTLVVQWLIRAIFIVPVLVLCLLLSYADIFKRYSQYVLGVTYLFVAVGLIFIIYYTPLTANREIYSTGLALVIFGAGAIKLRAKPNLTITPIIVVTYISLMSQKYPELLWHVPLLLSSSCLALLTSTSTENIITRNYILLSRLRLEREKLAESDRLKSKLFSIISHDLKNPMNNILSLMQLYNSQAITQKEFDEMFTEIKMRVQSTKELMEDLLVWSVFKLEGKQSVSEVNLAESVDQQFKALAWCSAQKGNTLINFVDASLIRTDKRLVNIVVRNLVVNANKFTENGSILCRSFREGNETVLSISDTGKGISQKRIQELFDWTKRYSESGTRGEKGTGLGLLICKDFLESIGGSISLQSIEGIGTTFNIRIPSPDKNEVKFGIARMSL